MATYRDRLGLPAWSYLSSELLEEEKERLFRSHWQLVGHVNDAPEPGDFLTCDFVGERALIVRGRGGRIGAFHNLCRHRGSRVIARERGRCGSTIVCPFHGWAYNLDGTLRGPARPDAFPKLDAREWGLKPIEHEIWRGFVFVRFKPGPQPSVQEILEPYDAELSQYGSGAMVPVERGAWSATVEANWKCIRDVDNEGYHVPKAHPGLHDLFGDHYYDQPYHGDVSRSFSRFRDGGGAFWSVRRYREILNPPDALDREHREAWLYIGIFPNLVFCFYPDSVSYYQEFPVAVGRSLQRGAIYRHPEEDRRMRLARYLSGRIDRIASREDDQLVRWCWEAVFSSGYDGVILSDLECAVRSYHDRLRTHFPILDHREPTPGTLAATNAALLARAAEP